MALDPIIQAIVDGTPPAAEPPADNAVRLQQSRDGYLMLRAAGGEDPPLASVVDRTIPGPAGDVPVRVYTPEGSGPFPVVVYFHGGGWTIGSIDSHDPVTRRMAAEAGAVVVSVEYRLAPEHPFPAAVDDSLAAFDWVFANAAELNGDPSKLAVAGDSAGGNLAAVAAIHARDTGTPLAAQILIYPSVDQREGYASYDENEAGPFLTKETMVWFKAQYAADPLDWRASPIVAEDLSRLAPALVITGQYDPLRDEGKAYAAALEEAGTPVTLHNYETMPHVFVQMWGVLPAAKECMTEIAETLKKAFAVSGS
ncbi:MAG TPA: alpha/beta hydrolase [Acidimicrobiales bacterium]|jgi:acetyl esterase|nr:alpha/beta hydrolase [Acidimicrobiales bacterium]